MSPFFPASPLAALPPGLVGCSGGRDSVALLHWLVEQGAAGLVVCHVNHGLRGRESGQDAAFVTRLAKRYGLPLFSQKVQVQQMAKIQGVSVETAAREVRLGFFAEVAQQTGLRHVYLAHQAEDQAETVLAHLARGCGLNGLTGMPVEMPFQVKDVPITLVRPLLKWRRKQIEQYLALHGLSWREDSTNAEGLVRRNRIRHEVLPLLEHIFERDVVGKIEATAALLRDEEVYLQEITRRLLAECLQADDRLQITGRLKAEPRALLRRVLRTWLVEVHGLGEIGFQEVERVLGLIQQVKPAKVNLPNDLHVRRKAGFLWVTRSSA